MSAMNSNKVEDLDNEPPKLNARRKHIQIKNRVRIYDFQPILEIVLGTCVHYYNKIVLYIFRECVMKMVHAL